jgi:RecB family endonuclease NucS
LEVVENGLQIYQRQYKCGDIGRIDLLCIDSQKNFVVIEVKKFKESNETVVAQTTRYMGFITENLLSSRQKVRGIIIVGKVDEKLRLATSVIPNLKVVSFSLSISS